jgi:hypothetical protein
MNELDLNAFLAVLLGLLFRFGIPVLVTALVAWGLRRLDQHWRLQSEHVRRAPLSLGAAAAEVRCWEQTDCPAEKRANCPAFNRPSEPCWQVFREPNGELAGGCLRCAVFRNAPARS